LGHTVWDFFEIYEIFLEFMGYFGIYRIFLAIYGIFLGCFRKVYEILLSDLPLERSMTPLKSNAFLDAIDHTES